MSKSKSPAFRFEENRDYQNVYFLKIDASGHSSVVAANTADVVDRFFGAFEDSVRAEINEAQKLNGCAYCQFWGWAGDGGLCVIYDFDEESRALKTAIEAGRNILIHRLHPLRRNLEKLKGNGTFKIRIAIHKGTMRYKALDQQGSIHAKDLNFAAHLETVTPHDALTISKDIYDLCSADLKDIFFPLPLEYESRKVFAFSEKDPRSIRMNWLAKIPIAESTNINLLPRRYSDNEKAEIIETAATEVIDLGTALSTCSNYLISGKRPSFYRDAVIALLQRQVKYICLVLDPESEVARFYAEQRGEKNLIDKIKISIQNLQRFASDFKGAPFEVWLYSSLPHFAAITIDRTSDGLILFAPYLPNLADMSIERADSPHMLFKGESILPFKTQVNAYLDNVFSQATTKRII